MKDSITIYSKRGCVYCDRAKNLLNEKDISFHEVMVDTSDQRAVSELQEKTGMRTFPQILIGNELLGGFAELSELEQKNGLIEFK
ncbi:glutathione S-transferase N-terminal domain-containing protein [bacterium]|nr:glutathione S-transferase N-terminal domain-containing protein [bacterium]